MKIVAISGSNKTKEPSLNNILLGAVEKLMPREVEFVVADIKDLPMYSEDYDEDFPQAAKEFKALVQSADALIIVTPEYNRSVPPMLSNAIAWSTRPYPENAWDGKVVATMGATGGPISTYAAQAHLKQILAHNHAIALPVNLYVGHFGDKMSGGEVTDKPTIEHLQKAIDRLIEVATKLKN